MFETNMNSIDRPCQMSTTLPTVPRSGATAVPRDAGSHGSQEWTSGPKRPRERSRSTERLSTLSQISADDIASPARLAGAGRQGDRIATKKTSLSGRRFDQLLARNSSHNGRLTKMLTQLYFELEAVRSERAAIDASSQRINLLVQREKEARRGGL